MCACRGSELGFALGVGEPVGLGDALGLGLLLGDGDALTLGLASASGVGVAGAARGDVFGAADV